MIIKYTSVNLNYWRKILLTFLAVIRFTTLFQLFYFIFSFFIFQFRFILFANFFSSLVTLHLKSPSQTINRYKKSEEIQIFYHSLYKFINFFSFFVIYLRIFQLLRQYSSLFFLYIIQEFVIIFEFLECEKITSENKYYNMIL